MLDSFQVCTKYSLTAFQNTTVKKTHTKFINTNNVSKVNSIITKFAQFSYIPSAEKSIFESC